jgi:hypothetical protein
MPDALIGPHGAHMFSVVSTTKFSPTMRSRGLSLVVETRNQPLPDEDEVVRKWRLGGGLRVHQHVSLEADRSIDQFTLSGIHNERGQRARRRGNRSSYGSGAVEILEEEVEIPAVGADLLGPPSTSVLQSVEFHRHERSRGGNETGGDHTLVIGNRQEG